MTEATKNNNVEFKGNQIIFSLIILRKTIKECDSGAFTATVNSFVCCNVVVNNEVLYELITHSPYVV